MHEAPQTAADLIEKCGGTHGLAAVLGFSVQAICNMRSRGTFPPRHWPVLIREAEKRGIPGVTLEWLESLGIASDDADGEQQPQPQDAAA